MKNSNATIQEKETNQKYIDGFVFPIHTEHLSTYKKAAEEIALIWKSYGAIAYTEYLGDDLFLQGTISFKKCLEANNDETIIFGWVEFPSREIRDFANEQVAKDPRMPKLIEPLLNPVHPIFNASRMAYAGFRSFIDHN